MNDLNHSLVHPEICWVGITGDFASGKTAFIRTISEQEVITVGFDIGFSNPIWFDFGQITVDKDLCLDLHGNPGAFSSSGVLKIPKPNLLGVIVMVNSAAPQHFPVARSTIASLSAYNLVPYVIAANPYEVHYDPTTNQFSRPIEGWPLDDLRLTLRVPDEIPMIPCVAVNKESVKHVLLALLGQVIGAIDASDEPQTTT